MELRHGCAIAVAVAALFILPTACPAAARSDPSGRRIVTLGRSVRGRPIVAIETGDFDSPRRTLLVGCIHGNEPAGISIAHRLARAAPPRELDLWIIPDLNPDGVAAGTRQNADHVDLNRNFPWRWQPLGGIFYSRPRPLSEPESRLLARLVLQLQPRVSIWFHQPYGLVDESGGDRALERRFAAVAGLPLRRLTRYPGGVTNWENARMPGSTAFVVELPAGTLTATNVTRFARAVVAVSRPSGNSARTGQGVTLADDSKDDVSKPEAGERLLRQGDLWRLSG